MRNTQRSGFIPFPCSMLPPMILLWRCRESYLDYMARFLSSHVVWIVRSIHFARWKTQANRMQGRTKKSIFSNRGKVWELTSISNHIQPPDCLHQPMKRGWATLHCTRPFCSSKLIKKQLKQQTSVHYTILSIVYIPSWYHYWTDTNTILTIFSFFYFQSDCSLRK